jgi:hypothetical protein
MSSGDEIPSVIQIEKFAHTQFYIAFTRHMKEALVTSPCQPPPISMAGPETVAELVDHYRLKELAGANQGRKSFSTRAGYESYLNGWIPPRWGDHRLDRGQSVAVEEWLDRIKRAKGTRAKACA